MSAWSDWRVGALTDEEYRSEAAYEARRDEDYDWSGYEETYEDDE